MPKVSVITPNYNHARYLPRRLDSILAQTFQDFELIVLDDASTDNSREVIESYARDPRVRAIFNAENNGSTFKQWSLGLSHARGEYIWFAESDDYADPSLLETLVGRLDRHPNVGLAYCQSWAVDENSRVLDSCIKILSSYFEPSRWTADFISSGREECTNYLFWHNTIPNASAVLLRHGTLRRGGGVPRDMRLNGDWMTYVNVLSISDVAFIATPLNYFRQHSGTVRSRFSNERFPTHEVLIVQRALIQRCGLPGRLRDNKQALAEYVNNWIGFERRPPHNKVPPGQSLALLLWFARMHPRAFRIALPTLAWEQMADLARRAGLLGTARRVKRMLMR
jgi:glycosyltransferase involved in cell wall biosynthesis